MVDSDSNEDRVTRAWVDNMSPHVSPPPAQSDANQAPASSTIRSGTAGAVEGDDAQTHEPREEDITGNADQMVTWTTALEEPASHSDTPRSLPANRRRVYKVHDLNDGRRVLTPCDGIVPECHDPGLLYNIILHIHWKDGRLLQIDAHLREDESTVIMRSLTVEEQAIWEEVLQQNRGVDPRLFAVGKGERTQEMDEDMVANRRWMEMHGPGRML